MTSSALSGIRVVDISSTTGGAWCSRLIAGFGASVAFVEPPGGHALRQFDAPSLRALADYVLAGKESLALDPSTPEGRETLIEQIASADVVVSSMTKAELASAGLSYANFDRPDLVMVHVTHYGVDGDLAGLPANDLAIAARSGWAAINGRADSPPLKPSGSQVAYCTGVAAFAGVVAALFHRDAHPAEGQEIDVAELDTMVQAIAPSILRSQYAGEVTQRAQDTDITTGPVPVADGHFALTISRAHFWRDAMNLLDLPDLASDPRWETSWYRQQNKAEYVQRVQEKMSQWTKADLFEELAARRVVAGPVLEFRELVANEHLIARGFWGSEGDQTHAGAPFKMSATPWKTTRSETAATTSIPAATPNRGHARPTDPRRRGPLAGTRGIVLTQAWAGALCTELLGMLGADIIQVEVRKRPDSWRGSYDGPIPAKLKDVETAQHPWNTSALYNSVNAGKRCITLDLQTPEGLDIYRRLLPHGDFVAENFSPRALGNLGLDYQSLRAIKPDIILCSLSAYGNSGPWANVPGIGGTIEPTSGMSALLGYEGGPPLNSGQMYPDAVAGYYGCAAIATALLHRNRTGEGQYIDLSMQEANLTFVGDAALEYLQTGKQRPRMGNSHPVHAPHGMFEAADGDWVAIACESTDQWTALAKAIGADALGSDSTLRDARERKQQRAAIDASISAWTRTRSREAIQAILERAGVIVAPVLDPLEVANEPGLRRRETIVETTHPEAGTWPQAALPIHFARTPGKLVSAAALLGEHSLEVLQELLDFTPEEYEALVDAGISGLGPPDAPATKRGTP